MLRRFIIALIVLSVIGAVGAFGLFNWAQGQYQTPGPHAQDRIVLIESGSSVIRIARTLRLAGILDNDLLFRLGVRYEGLSSSLKAGEYLIPAGASMKDVADILVSGKVLEHKMTVAEGLTTREILKLVNGDDRLSGGMVDGVAEGALLPETYFFTRGTERQALIQRMEQDQQALLQDAWASRAEDLPLNTPEEALVLASIVEKETGVPSERKTVASVFINRLNKGMPLQSDPTVIYALTEGQSDLGRSLTRQDWKFDHPYNTYVSNGLPPGPIANPGAEAIRAVLDPATTDFLYFVADGTGGHAFAKTLKEHNANVFKWRKIKRKAQE